MLSHSTLDDIEYSRYSHSTKLSIKRRHKHRHHRRHKHSHSHKRKSSKSTKFINHYVADKCAVCLDEETTLDTKLFPCGHQFHGQCLIQWVKVQTGGKFQCPLCRQNISNFIQMTGDQQINDELIAIWNEHYLFNNTKSTDETSKDDDAKLLLAKLTDTDTVTCAKNTKIECECQPVVVVENICIEQPKLKAKPIRKQKSIWKFIWNSPLSFIQKYKMQRNMAINNSLLYPIQFADVMYGANNEKKVSHAQWEHPMPCNDYYPFHTTNMMINYDDMPLQNDIAQQSIPSNNTPLGNILDFTSLNAESGLFAGLAAGSTSFLLSNAMRMSMLRSTSSLLPILSETVPSVAIFFTSYEHLKKYLFDVDNVNHSHLRTFSERFASAGIASSFAHIVSGGNGLLPLRFAAFFGTFELCKDVMNKRHEELNVAQVASSAAIGGTVAHSLYYPMTQPMQLMTASSEGAMASVSKQLLTKQMFNGCVSSLSKFLPSCVVCSCAFEFSKRYLSTL